MNGQQKQPEATNDMPDNKTWVFGNCSHEDLFYFITVMYQHMYS